MKIYVAWFCVENLQLNFDSIIFPFRGEKFMGIWLEDQRHGTGVVVTQFGLYYEGEFSNNKMVVSAKCFTWHLTLFWWLNKTWLLSVIRGPGFCSATMTLPLRESFQMIGCWMGRYSWISQMPLSVFFIKWKHLKNVWYDTILISVIHLLSCDLMQGVLSIPNGDSFDGIFVGEWGSELKVTGTFTKLCQYETAKTEDKPMYVFYNHLAKFYLSIFMQKF